MTYINVDESISLNILQQKHRWIFLIDINLENVKKKLFVQGLILFSGICTLSNFVSMIQTMFTWLHKIVLA